MKRRDFVATISAAAVAAPFGDLFADTKEKGGNADLVAVRNGEPAEMFDRAIAEMGGMSGFVKKGSKVVLKPNIGWDRTPDYGANTNPQLVGAVVRHCMEAGAAEVLCYDNTCGNNWEERYEMSGIKGEVEKYGGKMVTGQVPSMFVEQKIPKGISLKSARVHKLSINPDIFINMPVLKNHSGAKITCALKNYMGCIEDRQWWHKNNMPQCIADYATYQKTTLTVVDAYRIMLAGGPRGSSPKNAPVVKYQIVSTDIVAADVAAIQIFASVARQFKIGKPYEISEIAYIKPAVAHGVGTDDLTKLNVKRIAL